MFLHPYWHNIGNIWNHYKTLYRQAVSLGPRCCSSPCTSFYNSSMWNQIRVLRKLSLVHFSICSIAYKKKNSNAHHKHFNLNGAPFQSDILISTPKMSFTTSYVTNASAIDGTTWKRRKGINDQILTVEGQDLLDYKTYKTSHSGHLHRLVNVCSIFKSLYFLTRC